VTAQRGIQAILAAVLPIVIVMLAVACSEVGTQPAEPATTIVVVIMDTVRRDHLSVYGYGRDTTPRLRALAAESRLFHQAYSTSCWTSPAHASLFTGLYPIAHATTQQQWTLAPELSTLAEILRDRGYETRAVIGNPMLSRYRGFDQGFSEYFQAWSEHDDLKKRGVTLLPTLDELSARQVEALLETRDPAAPLFLFVNLIGPHAPYDSCGDFCEHFVDKRPAAPGTAYGATRLGAILDHYVGNRELTATELWHQAGLYDAELLQADHIVGRIIDAMKRAGIWDGAFFAVTSDHGENFGEQGHVGHVFSLTQATTRIPLLVRDAARLSVGSVDEAPAQLTDLFSTVLRAAGVDPSPFSPHGMDLADSRGRRRRPVFTEYYRPRQALGLALLRATPEERSRLARFNRALRSVIVEDQKLVWGSDGRHELYDLKSDPLEQGNLIARPERADDWRRLQERLDELIEQYRPEQPLRAEEAPMDEATRRALEAIGYFQ
jgi:arylsulfatase A-like enzyme